MSLLAIHNGNAAAGAKEKSIKNHDGGSPRIGIQIAATKITPIHAINPHSTIHIFFTGSLIAPANNNAKTICAKPNQSSAYK